MINNIDSAVLIDFTCIMINNIDSAVLMTFTCIMINNIDSAVLMKFTCIMINNIDSAVLMTFTCIMINNIDIFQVLEYSGVILLMEHRLMMILLSYISLPCWSSTVFSMDFWPSILKQCSRGIMEFQSVGIFHLQWVCSRLERKVLFVILF